MSETLSLKEAQDQFVHLMQCLNKIDQEQLILFILREWKPNAPSSNTDIDDMYNNVGDEVTDDPVFLLNTIANDIKAQLPIDAILPSENIKPPKRGENSDCDPNITIHIDEFLYTDDDVSELADSDKIKRHYCRDCGSKNIEPLIYISHSTSRDALYHIFNNRLPTLKDKTILDIGSRLGAILYGAYVYTDASRIIGVEMNEEFCALQRDIIKKYKMENRIEILHKRIEEVPEVIKDSDVVLINNSFEFYLSEKEQIHIWNMLRADLKKGAILVTRPPLDVAFKPLKIDISINDWLKPLEVSQSKANLSLFYSYVNEENTFSDIAFYEVR